MSDTVIAESAARYRKTLDAPLSELLSRMWGGHLHMGRSSDRTSRWATRNCAPTGI